MAKVASTHTTDAITRIKSKAASIGHNMASHKGHSAQGVVIAHGPSVSELLDREARASLNMSGDQFLVALKKGNLPDTPAVAHLKILAGTPRRG